MKSTLLSILMFLVASSKAYSEEYEEQYYHDKVTYLIDELADNVQVKIDKDYDELNNNFELWANQIDFIYLYGINASDTRTDEYIYEINEASYEATDYGKYIAQCNVDESIRKLNDIREIFVDRLKLSSYQVIGTGKQHVQDAITKINQTVEQIELLRQAALKCYDDQECLEATIIRVHEKAIYIYSEIGEIKYHTWTILMEMLGSATHHNEKSYLELRKQLVPISSYVLECILITI